MTLFVGLGNIGRQYKDTPHNAGFEFMNVLRQKFVELGYDVSQWKNEKLFEADICKIKKDGELLFTLLKPTTFMNLSGRSVRKYISKNMFKEVVIVHDDLDILLGDYKIQRGKSPKEHNGVNSIEPIEGSEKFLRVRIGIENRKVDGPIPGDVYVIKRMKPESLEKLNKSINEASVALLEYFNIV